MEPSLARADRVRVGPRRRAEAWSTPARPLVRPAPRSSVFFPLVVLVAVLPGLYGLKNWDLNPPGPWWGLRGLAVLEGRAWDQVPAASGMGPAPEAAAFRAVALQPPLYAWLEAAALALSPDRAPVATVLPGYVAGVVAVVLVFLLGRSWIGSAGGLVAAVLVGFNRDLLAQMQQPSPTTLGLAGALTALLAYGRHLRRLDGTADAGRRGVRWTIVGGLGLGVSLLSVRGLALACPVIILLHQAYLGAEPKPYGCRGRGRPWLRCRPGLWAGVAALALGLGMAVPWHASMIARHGPEAARVLWGVPELGVACWPGLLAGLLDLAPATVPLGLFGAWRAVRRALVADRYDREADDGAFLVFWLAIAAVLPAAWPGGPRPSLALFLMVPLNLLAARAMTDLAARRIPVRALAWLGPATAAAMAWWASSHLREAVTDLARGCRPAPTTALGLHLGLDLLLVAVLVGRNLDRWTGRRDDRRRLVLGGFLATVVLGVVGSGLREVNFRHRETAELIDLRSMILRRDKFRPFTLAAVVEPVRDPLAPEGPAPAGRLRFLLRSTLPRLAQLDLADTDDLLQLPEGQRLVVLVGDRRLSYAGQTRLNLEVIHPHHAGFLEGFATAAEDHRSSPEGFAGSGGHADGED